MNISQFNRMVEEITESCFEINAGNYSCDKCVEFDDVLEILQKYISIKKDVGGHQYNKPLSQEEYLKQRDEYRKDFQEFCERREKDSNQIRFRTLTERTDNFS